MGLVFDCGSPAGAETSGSDQTGTDVSTSQTRTKTRTSNLKSRPQWGSNQPSHKYLTNSEKDPRFLKRRRERLRRRQRAFLEKQLHGSWPSSESSGSREEMFFPFLPSAHSPVERFYDAGQTGLVLFPSNASIPSNRSLFQTGRTSLRDGNLLEPIQPQPCRSPVLPVGPVDRSLSPPVPALLKKLRLANGETVTEKHEWEDYEEKEANKINKEFENLKIRENHDDSNESSTQPDREKQDLLFRLSLLKKGLEQRKTALDDQISIISSHIQ